MPTLFFYLFSALAVTGAILLISFRNPVSSALSMVLSFVGMAGLFTGLNAYFVGIIQILVYAGAIMVLFIFIIMLLDLSKETKVKLKTPAIFAGGILPLLLVIQILGVIQSGPEENEFSEITTEVMASAADDYRLRGKDGELLMDDQGEVLPREEQSAIYKSLTHEKSPKLPDTNLIGFTLFKDFNFPLQVMGILLLVSTVGVVVLSKRSSSAAPPQS
ncbi:MAG: NADH-quinone oxidoreductase subunit J [Akkermansiaceae bacterium]